VKQLTERNPLLRGGLACLAAVLASLFMISQFREAFPPRADDPVIPERPAAPSPEGPPMRIDHDDLARVGTERDDNGLAMTFCWCPSGTFHMGRAANRPAQSLEAGPVRVTLRQGFWMGKFEVTQAQWQRLTGATLREQRAKDPGQPRPVGDETTRDHVGEGPDYPIYYTSHAEAEEFCRKLTEAERTAGRLERGWEYRLPTEAQWEFACRAGTTTATAFGEKLSSIQANFDGSQPFNGAPAGPYLHETTPVGRYPANGWGLHDMHGNVWEWCRDGFTETPGGGTDPLEEPSSSRRTYRGGCWHNPGALCLSTVRAWGEVGDRGSGLGFRVALVPSGS
jgi:formylglycine-generating enzyme required for sulfatase activity